jgi:hypothetical protein
MSVATNPGQSQETQPQFSRGERGERSVQGHPTMTARYPAVGRRTAAPLRPQRSTRYLPSPTSPRIRSGAGVHERSSRAVTPGGAGIVTLAAARSQQQRAASGGRVEGRQI